MWLNFHIFIDVEFLFQGAQQYAENLKKNVNWKTVTAESNRSSGEAQRIEPNAAGRLSSPIVGTQPLANSSKTRKSPSSWRRSLNGSSEDSSNDSVEDLSDDDDERTAKKRRLHGPEEWLCHLQQSVDKYKKKSVESIFTLQQQFQNVNERIIAMKAAHQQEKSKLVSEIEQLKKEIEQLRKSKDLCRYCSQPVTSVTFCSKDCYKLSSKYERPSPI